MGEEYNSLRSSLLAGIPAELPDHPGLDLSVDNAPNRRQILSKKQKKLALKKCTAILSKTPSRDLANELLTELDTLEKDYHAKV